MRKLDYLNTRKGQLNLRWKRKLARLYFSIDQEPKVKASDEANIRFQNNILNTLKELKRRAYRSPVILELTFTITENNPPSIYKLAKHYIDLLEKPIEESKIRRKNLLFSNDRLIKILIVNYYIYDKDSKPHISIKSESFSNFLKDVELIDRIKTNNFFENGNGLRCYSSNYMEFKIDYNNGIHNSHVHDPIEELRSFERNKNSFINIYGEKVYNIQRNFFLKLAQLNYLKASEFKINHLISLFSPNIHKNTSKYKKDRLHDFLGIMEKQYRNLLFSPPFSIDLSSTPTRSGEDEVFKSHITKVLDDFKRKYPILFPLRNLLSVTILFVPPKRSDIDLDNLASYIIPIINEKVQPPSSFLELIDSCDNEDLGMRKFINNKRNIMPNIPKFGITNYQVIKLPRLEDDPENGYVRLIFEDGSKCKNLLSNINIIIDKWEENIDEF